MISGISFEVFASVIVWVVFGVVMPFSSIGHYQFFILTCCLHLRVEVTSLKVKVACSLEMLVST
jgi:hypothetical protein